MVVFLFDETTAQLDWSRRFPFATTYNCLPGDTVSVRGRHFGGPGAQVTVGAQPCAAVRVRSETELDCVLPDPDEIGTGDGGSDGAGNGGERSGTDVEVAVSQADLPLRASAPYLSFQRPPPLMAAPRVSNVAARSMDLTWRPPGDLWDQLTVSLRSHKPATTGMQACAQALTRRDVRNLRAKKKCSLLFSQFFALSYK